MVNKATMIESLTKNGLRNWLVQRVTAVILGVYIIFLVGFFLCNPSIQYYTWAGLFANDWMRFFSLLFLLSLVWHAWIGVWTIVTDYVKCVIGRLVLLTLIIMALFAYFIWGIQILWGI